MRLDDEVWNVYWHSRHAFHAGDIAAAEAMYRRLRANHGVELYYEVDLKMPVRFVHPIGSVLGRANYAPHLVVYQNVGVGSDLDGNRPTFTGPCVLFPGSKVLGETTIGANVFITANTVVQNCEIPDNSVVYPDISAMNVGAQCCWRETKRSVIKHFFPDSAPTPA